MLRLGGEQRHKVISAIPLEAPAPLRQGKEPELQQRVEAKPIARPPSSRLEAYANTPPAFQAGEHAESTPEDRHLLGSTKLLAGLIAVAVAGTLGVAVLFAVVFGLGSTENSSIDSAFHALVNARSESQNRVIADLFMLPGSQDSDLTHPNSRANVDVPLELTAVALQEQEVATYVENMSPAFRAYWAHTMMTRLTLAVSDLPQQSPQSLPEEEKANFHLLCKYCLKSIEQVYYSGEAGVKRFVESRMIGKDGQLTPELLGVTYFQGTITMPLMAVASEMQYYRSSPTFECSHWNNEGRTFLPLNSLSALKSTGVWPSLKPDNAVQIQMPDEEAYTYALFRFKHLVDKNRRRD